MACKDCDRFSDCKYKISSSTWSELARGTERYISGKDCPKKWQDKKVEDMTEEQRREAVKELRGKVLSTTENKSVEEITYSSEPLLLYDPKGTATQDYILLTKRIMEIMG